MCENRTSCCHLKIKLPLSGNLIWQPLQFHVFFEVFGRRGVAKAVDAITVKRQTPDPKLPFQVCR